MSEHPFLSIVTRTHKRPRNLAECKASIAQLTDDDYEHVVVVDEVGVGHDGAYQLCIDAFDEGRVNGRYVWFLDDDDRLADPEFITRLKEKAEQCGGNPPVIVVRHMNETRIWPEDGYWGNAPVRRHIGMGCMVVRADVWREHAPNLRKHPYAGDIFMIMSMYNSGVPFEWLDIIGTLKGPPADGLSDEEMEARGLRFVDPRPFHK